jgi:hypothetical protein
VKAKIIRIGFLHLCILLLATTSFSQMEGRVVINEYMPRTSNTCGTTSEFVELMNYGPGPVNIGCFILTTGVYAITIPPNTILQPGEFYILAGRNFIPGTCANIDSAATGVHADLNWNSGNYANQPIPQTGDGLMADDGSTPLVLLDPSKNVVDAVIRSLPAPASVSVTSSNLGGLCTSQTFDINTMSLNYEELGMAPGNQNSFARSLDGDCNWLKQPSQSGNASNNRSGNGTDISYEFDMVNPTSCDETPSGSVSIYVKHSNYATVFPMSYTIVVDSDNNGVYDFTDQYTTVVDNEPPFIEIDNLPVGRFRVTVASTKGCYLRSFDFTIISCNPGTLPVNLVYFKNKGGQNGLQELEWLLQDVQNLQSIVVEKAKANGKFVAEKVLTGENARGSKVYALPVASSDASYRLRITQKNGKTFYSPVVYLGTSRNTGSHRLGPNPATDKLNLQLWSNSTQKTGYVIYNSNGLAVYRGSLSLVSGENNTAISVQALPAGSYHLQVTSLPGEGQPISFRFVKH